MSAEAGAGCLERALLDPPLQVLLAVQGNGGAGSAVFKQYCPNVTCGTASGPGYVAGDYTLPAWTTNGTATLALSTPTTMHKLQTNEVYRVNLLWTLSSGP